MQPGLQKATTAELLVLHCAGRSRSFFSFYRDVPTGNTSTQQQAMASLLKELHDCTENTPDINTTILANDFNGGLNRICTTYKPDIVVIGFVSDKPDSGIFGSKAINAAKHSKVPLIVVPAEYPFQKISRIGLTSDLAPNIAIIPSPVKM